MWMFGFDIWKAARDGNLKQVKEIVDENPGAVNFRSLPGGVSSRRLLKLL